MNIRNLMKIANSKHYEPLTVEMIKDVLFELSYPRAEFTFRTDKKLGLTEIRYGSTNKTLFQVTTGNPDEWMRKFHEAVKHQCKYTNDT